MFIHSQVLRRDTLSTSTFFFEHCLPRLSSRTTSEVPLLGTELIWQGYNLIITGRRYGTHLSPVFMLDLHNFRRPIKRQGSTHM
jgi:hypothetical protein